MEKPTSSDSVYDITIRLLILLLIAGACLLLMFPFVNIILWSIILAMALYPLHSGLSKALGNSPKIASAIIILVILLIVIVPAWFLIGSLINEIKELKLHYDTGTLTIPAPPEKVKTWPVVGQNIYDTWQSASDNFQKFILKYRDDILDYGGKIAKGILSAFSAILQIMISLVIAGFLLVYGRAAESTRKFFRKVADEKGDEYADLTLKTVGSVVKGILGESLIMAILNGAVFFLAGVPYAGLWAILAFIFAVLQLPVLLVTVPVIIYFFATLSVVAAVLWTVALLLVALSDNVLTPLMLGKGAPVPMLVMFVGVIGGFVVFGFIGLFTGAIIMSLGYKLFQSWVESAWHPE